MKNHIFTLVILSLYSMNVIWYGVQGLIGNSLYWLFAAGITVCATWGMR